MRSWLVIGWLCALGLAGCDRGVDAGRIEAADAAEWLTYGRTYDEQRFSPLKQVDAASVGRLGVAWWTEFDTDRGQEASPLVADGVLYTTTAWSKVAAFDAATGEKLWSFDPKVPGEAGFNACCDVVNRGVALWKGQVFVGTIDGRLIALDAKTGAQAWSVQTTDVRKPYTITGAPRVIKGKVLIGNGGAEYGVRGFVSAYEADTGALAWRFYTTPNPRGVNDGAASDAVLRDKAAATWSKGTWLQSGGGGTAWDAITYDPKLDLVYVGVGNGSPWNHKLRSGGKGDNLFLSSIVALRPDTGEYVWHYQTTPGESWDYTATQHIMVADLTLAGAPRRVVMQAPKNGFFYVLDAATGKLISAEKFQPVTWAERIDLATGRPVETPGARYEDGKPLRHLGGAIGAHNWQPMAYSPPQGLVYIPAIASHGTYGDPAEFKYVDGIWNTGQRRSVVRPSEPRPAPPPPTPYGELVAWDPVKQAARWRQRFPMPWTGGVLATDGGLVFHAAGRQLSAYGAGDGKRLWAYDTGANAVAPAVTYSVKGQQYVALMVGYGGAGAGGGTEPRRPGRLLVFALDGKVRPPAYPEVTPQPALDLSLASASGGDAERGAVVFRDYCAACHGGGVYLPNLARSPAILERATFEAVVLDGALAAGGMTGFRKWFGPEWSEDLRAYLLWRARTDPAPGKAPTGAPALHAQ